MPNVSSVMKNRHVKEVRLRRARRIVLIALSVIVLQIPAFALVGLFNMILMGHPSLWRGVVGLVLSVLLASGTLWHTAKRIENDGERSDTLYWAMFACLTGTLVLFDLDLWTALIASVWFSVSATSYPIRPVLLSGVFLCALPWARVLFYEEPDWTRVILIWAIALCFAAFFLVGNLGILRLWDLSKEVVAGRQAQARLAVSDERLRIARDIHDLLGHSLSGIAVRSQLAVKLTERDPSRAALEMMAVQETAREALREVRSAVSGYRDVDPCEELEGVRSLLTASGVRCELVGDVGSVPTHLSGPVAWIIREAGTNIMRHSVAKKCEFSFHRSLEWIVVEIVNDGVLSKRHRANRGLGSGITGLTERVASVNGTLTASADNRGSFLLRAALPLDPETVADESERNEMKETT